MIFVTVGTQLPFPRLIDTILCWAEKTGRQSELFIQYGRGIPPDKAYSSSAFITAEQTEHCFSGADMIVAHAGMGSVLTALKYRKPIIIMPRRAELGEHRNDHQMATARWLASKHQGVIVAWDSAQLYDALNRGSESTPTTHISEFAPIEFTSRLRTYINSQQLDASPASRTGDEYERP